VFDTPSWVDGLIEALCLAAEGRVDEADRAREIALDQAPLVDASTSRFRFDWIADSDSRFGPVCEIVAAGHYRWLPFSDLVAWQIAPPARLIDLVWAPCALTLVDGTTVRGFMPARYPISDEAGTDNDERAALRLGRKTIWRELGRTGVIALGQKTWATSAGDFGLFELQACEFGTGATQDASHDASAQRDGDDGLA
jgi:type VI secretion system protein ImpE